VTRRANSPAAPKNKDCHSKEKAAPSNGRSPGAVTRCLHPQPIATPFPPPRAAPMNRAANWPNQGAARPWRAGQQTTVRERSPAERCRCASRGSCPPPSQVVECDRAPHFHQLVREQVRRGGRDNKPARGLECDCFAARHGRAAPWLGHLRKPLFMGAALGGGNGVAIGAGEGIA